MAYSCSVFHRTPVTEKFARMPTGENNSAFVKEINGDHNAAACKEIEGHENSSIVKEIHAEEKEGYIVVKSKTIGQEPVFVSNDLRFKLINNFCVKKPTEKAANGTCKHILPLSRGQVLGAPKINTELAQVLSHPQKPFEKFVRYTGNS